MTLLVEFVKIIVGGIVEFGSGLASGINGFVQNLFMQQSGETTILSYFAQVLAILAGIAISIGVTRRIFNMVASLGGRR